MAKVGLMYMVAAPFESHTDGSKPVYGKGIVATKMVSADLTYEKNEVEFYADDAMAESDNAITGGSLTMEGDHFSNDARVLLFGVTKETDDDGDAYVTRAQGSPYVGFGFIQVEQLAGAVTYKATWVYKAQFSTQGISGSTKGRNTEFRSTQVSGKFMGVVIDQKAQAFIRDRDFSTPGAAKEWLNTLANVTPAA